MKAIRVLATVLLFAALAGGYLVLFGPADVDTGGAGSVADQQLGKTERGKDLRADPGASQDSGRDDPEAGREVVAPRRGARRAAGTAALAFRLVQGQNAIGGAKAMLVLHRDKAKGQPEIVTDGKGRASAGELPAGKWTLAFDHADVPWNFRTAPFELKAGQTNDLGDIEVPKTAGLRGRAIGPGGAAVAAADVYIRAGVLSSILSRDPAPYLEARTDASGSFKLERLMPREYLLACDHASYMRAEQIVRLAPGDYLDIGSIRLERGRELTGTVVDEAGRGISGAKVSFRHVAKDGNNQVDYYAERRAVETDANGRFALAGLPAEVKLKVFAEGFETVTGHAVDSDARVTRVVLRPRRGVAGIVTNAGEHATTVWLLPEPARMKSGELDIKPRRHTKVGKDGRFFFGKIEPGRYRVMADAPGFGASRTQRIRVARAGKTGIELTLETGARLEVRVTDTTGKPVPQARVRLRVQSDPNLPGDFSPSPERVARTDQAGSAVLLGVWRGRGELDVSHSDYLSARRDKLVLREDVVTVDIRLETGGWIAGRCVDMRGESLEGIHVSARPKPKPQAGGVRIRTRTVDFSMAEKKRQRSARDGTFRLGPMRPGEYLVEGRWKDGRMTFGNDQEGVVFSDGGGNADARVSAVVAAGKDSPVVLRLSRPGSLAGTVRYRGQLVAGARVFARRKKAGAGDTIGGVFSGPKAVADSNGRYRFEELQTGTWNVSVKPPKGPIASNPVEVEIRDSAESLEDLELAGGQVRAIITRPQGDTRDLSDLEVILSKAGGARQVRQVAIMMRTDSNGNASGGSMRMQPPDQPEPVKVAADGKVVVQFVPEGKWLVRVVSGDDVTLWSKHVEVVDGQVQDLGAVRLEPSYPVKLEIIGIDGGPAGFGTVAVYERLDGGKRGRQVFRELARHGSVKISGLVPGTYTLEYRPIEMSQAGDTAPPQPQEGELVVGQDGSLTGSKLRLKE